MRQLPQYTHSAMQPFGRGRVMPANGLGPPEKEVRPGDHHDARPNQKSAAHTTNEMQFSGSRRCDAATAWRRRRRAADRCEPIGDTGIRDPWRPWRPERLDKRIRLLVGAIEENLTKLHALVAQAKSGQIHVALGFKCWTTYVADVFTLQVRLDRPQRRELVGWLSGEGMSQRVIADVVGVDQKTVSNDLRAGEEFSSPEPGVDELISQGVVADVDECRDIMAMAEMSGDEFDEVLADARSEDDLSRENVAGSAVSAPSRRRSPAGTAIHTCRNRHGRRNRRSHGAGRSRTSSQGPSVTLRELLTVLSDWPATIVLLVIVTQSVWITWARSSGSSITSTTTCSLLSVADSGVEKNSMTPSSSGVWFGAKADGERRSDPLDPDG